MRKRSCVNVQFSEFEPRRLRLRFFEFASTGPKPLHSHAPDRIPTFRSRVAPLHHCGAKPPPTPYVMIMIGSTSPRDAPIDASPDAESFYRMLALPSCSWSW